jgi:hypothetical protein
VVARNSAEGAQAAPPRAMQTDSKHHLPTG